MHRVESDLLTVRTVARVQVAAPVRLAVRLRHEERAHRHRHAVREAHEHPRPLEIAVPVRVAAHELAVRRVDAVPVPVEQARADAAHLLLFAHGELHGAGAPRLAALLDLLVAVPGDGDEQLRAAVGRPVEVRAAPVVLEAAAQLRAVLAHGEGGRFVPRRRLVDLLVEPVHGAREEEDVRARLVLLDDRVAVVGEWMAGLARIRLRGGHEAAALRDGEDELVLARPEVHHPQTVVLGPLDVLAGVLSGAGVAVVGAREGEARVVDRHGPCAVLAHGAHGKRQDAHVLLRLPVHDHRHELAVADVVEEERVVVDPVGHRGLLEVPARRGGDRNELVVVLQVHEAERAALARLGEASVEVGLQHGDVALVRAPGVDREVAREEMLVRALRDGAGVAPFRERRELFGLKTEAEAQRGKAGEAEG